MKPVKVKITSQQEANALKGLLTFFDHPVDQLMFECYNPIMFLVKTRQEKEWILVSPNHSILPKCDELTIEDFITSVVLPKKAESILDGKVAIQVNNEREFKLLMDHYESKGWRSKLGNVPTDTSVWYFMSDRKDYDNIFSYKNEFKRLSYKQPDFSPIELGYTIISFADFASEVGIKVPVFIMKSEDGVDLYEGEEYHGIGLDTESKWMYSGCYPLNSSNVSYLKSGRAKAFSTREAAEKWISEMNKPKEIRLVDENDQDYAVVNGNGFIAYINRYNSNQLESIYQAYLSLQ
jgi:hypothetical protein